MIEKIIYEKLFFAKYFYIIKSFYIKIRLLRDWKSEIPGLFCRLPSVMPEKNY